MTWSSEPAPRRQSSAPMEAPPLPLLNERQSERPAPIREAGPTSAPPATWRLFRVQCGERLPVEVHASHWPGAFARAISLMSDLGYADEPADIHARTFDGRTVVVEDRTRGLTFTIEGEKVDGSTPVAPPDVTLPSPLALPVGVLPPEAEQTDETEMDDGTNSTTNPFSSPFLADITRTVPKIDQPVRTHRVIPALLLAMFIGIVVGALVALLGA